MYSIGIDIGTTSICAVLMNSQTGKIITTATHQNDSFIPTPNVWEKIQDVAVIEEKVSEVISHLFKLISKRTANAVLFLFSYASHSALHHS